MCKAVECLESIGCKSGEVGLQVESQTAAGRVHLATEITPEFDLDN